MGGLDFCGQTGVRLTEALCGRCASCQLWLASALSDEGLADEVSRRRSLREAEIEAVAPDLLHGEAASGYKRLSHSPGGPLTARCLSCERVFSSQGIAKHARGCRERRRSGRPAKRMPPEGPKPSLLPTDLIGSAQVREDAAPAAAPPAARSSLRDALARFGRTRGT